MKKIYTADWVKGKPYEKVDEVDLYYVDLANRVLKTLRKYAAVDMFERSEQYMEMALRITGWFEDICSNIGTWRVLNEECSKRYGAPLPFYDTEKYYPGEVNEADVRLLLWSYLQYINPRHSLINPENPALEGLARQLSTLLESEYEYAPENERLYDYVHNPAIAEDWTSLRIWLNWFYLNSYVYVGQLDRIDAGTDELVRMDLVSAELLYAKQVDLVFNDKSNLLSLTAPKWCARITGYESVEKLVKLETELYIFESVGDNCFCLRDMMSGRDYEVQNVDVGDCSQLFKEAEPNISVIQADLATFGGNVYLCGVMGLVGKKDSPYVVKTLDEKKEYEKAMKNCRELYRGFVKSTGGSQFAFAKDYHDLLDFYVRRLKIKDAAKSQIPSQLLTAKYITMIGDSDKGVCLSPESALVLKHEDNPFYDSEFAKQNAIGVYVDCGYLPYKQACIAHDEGMLPEAAINSLKGTAYGKEFVRRHGSYLIDYFYKCTREYDF